MTPSRPATATKAFTRPPNFMDKTTVIVVSACVALLAGNFWYQSTLKEDTAAAPASVPAATAAPLPSETPADTSIAPPAEQPGNPATAPATDQGQPPTEPQGADSPATPTTPALPEPVAASPATRVPQVIATLVSKDAQGKEVARYSFQDIGGSLKSVEMLGKPINSTKKELQQDVSINGNVPQGIGTLMSGLSNDTAPLFDDAAYSVVPERTHGNQVTLLGRKPGITIVKTYRLKPLQKGDQSISGNAYMLDLQVEIQNTGSTPLAFHNWGLYAGGMCQVNHEESSRYTYYVRLEDGNFEKDSIGSFDPFFGTKKERLYTTDNKNIEWAGLMNQYYSTLVIARENAATKGLYAAPAHYRLPVTGEEVDGVELALALPSFTLSPKTNEMLGGYQKFTYEIFTGPKLNMMLSDMTDEVRMIDRIMDYGWLYLLSYPMNWLINIFHGWFGNWGWAIVAMTFVVRLIIWPLYRKSYMSMKRMSLLQPKMQELKEKYPDDQQKVSMEMMKLYREYGISPMGGCLPMLLQIPIFFAFFYVLQTAAEFRGAPFLGWVTDLSQMDTFYSLSIGGFELPINILPILMAISMMAQMAMNPATGDATQQKIIKWMPLFFFLFCYTYASALALYWTTTNIISIIQTLIIRRMPMPTLQKVTPQKGKSGKKGFFERVMDAQQAALKEQQRQAQMRNVTKK